MGVRTVQRRSTSDPWPTSSILGATNRRLGLAFAAIGALWAGVLWVALTPPGKAGLAAAPSAGATSQAQAPPPAGIPQRVGLRALAMSGEPVGLNGSFERFGLERQT